MAYSSQAGQVILKTQATPGTLDPALGTGGVGIKLRGGSLGPNRELLIPDPEIGGGRDVVDAYLGAVSWGGSYDFYARMNSLLTLLNAVLGTTTSPAAVAGVVTHSIAASDAGSLPFLSIEERIGAALETYTYYDAVVNTLHLEAEANGFLMGTADVIASRQTAGATPTATPLWDDTFMTVGTNIAVTYNGVTVPAKSFSFDINNNFEDDDFRLGSFFLGALTPKRREVTASFTLRPDTSAMWRQATYGTSAATAPGGVTTKQALVITMSTYENIPSTAVPYQLVVTIPKFILKPFALGPSGDDIVQVDVEGQAVRPVAGTPILSVTLKSEKTAVS